MNIIKVIDRAGNVLYAAEYKDGRWLMSDGSVINEAFIGDYDLCPVARVSAQLVELFEKRAQTQEVIDELVRRRDEITRRIRMIREECCGEFMIVPTLVRANEDRLDDIRSREPSRISSVFKRAADVVRRTLTLEEE